MSKKWYENIPPQGILIHIKDDDFNEIIVFKPEHLERFSIEELDRCTPLTHHEWWKFAPWQSIETVTRSVRILLMGEWENLMNNEDFETQNENKIICPYCGEIYGYSSEVDEDEIVCNCGETFIMQREFIAVYSTHKMD